MKRVIFLLAVFCVFVPCVTSLSSDLRTSYAPKETMIGEITGAIAPIDRDQVRIVRDGHIDIGVQYDVVKLGGQQFIWVMAPANEGNYQIIIEDVVAFVEGVPEVTDFTHDFVVEGDLPAYSISPGVVLTNEDFKITATVYESQQLIQTNFPEQRDVVLYPGTNYVDFSIDEIIGVQQTVIDFGIYQVPARILGADHICGDGEIDGEEVCDGDNLDGKNCRSVDSDFVGGVLRCSSGCLAFDTGSCELIEEDNSTCGSAHLNLCLDESGCSAAGGYWYDEICNKYEDGSECDSQHVELCETFGTCYDAEGYWYDDSCHEEKEAECGNGIIDSGEECDGQNLSEANCSAIGFDSGELGCRENCKFNVSKCRVASASGPVSFFVNPATIRSTVLINEDLPIYYFVIVNDGEDEIDNLRFDYNPSKFLIEPSHNISIGLNESQEFTLTLKEAWRGRPFNGVVIAHDDDFYEYMIVEINFTEDEGERSTEYSRSSGEGLQYYCAELSGYSCASDETCDGEVVSTIDVSKCCVGNCQEEDGSGGRSWIGWLIACIVIVAGAIIFLKYLKAGKGGGKNVLQTRLAKQKELP